MSPEEAAAVENTENESGVLRIYEMGYHISPATKEEDLEKVVASIRSVVEKASGSFIAEGAPSLIKLAYPMPVQEGGKRVEYDRGYFGWIKFEAQVQTTALINESLKQNTNLLRHIVFETVREDTRAKIKVGTLREVKRTDAIKAAPRRQEEVAAPVSEEELEKALQDITAE